MCQVSTFPHHINTFFPTQCVISQITPHQLSIITNSSRVSGCFNLDPNRVLDVILDSFENHYEQSDFYIPLLRAYMPQSKTLSDVLGFKYVHYIEAKLVTPKSLYMITAFLLQHEAILLDDMYGWVSYIYHLFFIFRRKCISNLDDFDFQLQPDDSSIAKDWEGKLEEARKRFKENNALVISRKETENEDWNTPSEEELLKVRSLNSHLNLEIAKTMTTLQSSSICPVN